ncbi:MAG: HAMP domain-containing protein, partial [Oscillospiraceae bacterium]|nr:HAMP domain-containing protein [Oscillospiraceae bacterium]
MKLRTKITAIAALVILLAAAVSDSVIWMICRRSMIGEAEQTVCGQMVMLQSKYAEYQTKYKGVMSDSEQRFFFKQYGSDYVICLRGKQEIYNQTVLTPEDLLNMKISNPRQGQPAATGELQIRRHKLLIAKAEYPDYTNIFVIYDLADVTHRLRLLAIGMLGVLLGVSIPAVIVLYLLLRRTMEPLGSLSDSAKRITAGAYEERAAVSGNDEVGLLAQDFNLMANAVQEKINALAESEQRKTM